MKYLWEKDLIYILTRSSSIADIQFTDHKYKELRITNHAGILSCQNHWCMDHLANAMSLAHILASVKAQDNRQTLSLATLTSSLMELAEKGKGRLAVEPVSTMEPS